MQNVGAVGRENEMKKRLLGSVGAALMAVGACATAASAEMLPSYSTGVETIRGTISSFEGKYSLRVHDARGYIDNVTLHDGTIINPIGLTLSQGMSVTILGRTRGRTFEATEIDTPYRYEQRVFTPVYVTPSYAGSYYGYSGGYYGYPYAYGAAPFGYQGYYGPGGYGYGSSVIVAPGTGTSATVVPGSPGTGIAPSYDRDDRFRSFHAGEMRHR